MFGKPKKLTPFLIADFFVHACRAIEDYNIPLKYFSSIVFPRKKKVRPFWLKENAIIKLSLKCSGMWPREFTILAWQAKPRDECRQRLEAKSSFTHIFEFEVYLYLFW